MTRKQDLQDRLQRAMSGIGAAEGMSSEQNHERFVFYYVALNAMYSRRQYEGNRSDVWQDLDRFVDQVKQMCTNADEGATRERLVNRCERDLSGARLKVLIGDPFLMLRTVLRRLTVLRNRVMHGCVTYGAVPKGLPSVVKGARSLEISSRPCTS